MADIIDNREFKLVEEIKKISVRSQSAKFAIGYFFISGFKEIFPIIKDLDEIRIIMGNATTKETLEELAIGYKNLSSVEEKINENRFLNKSQKRGVVEETANLQKELIEIINQTNENRNYLSDLAKMIEIKKLKIKVYTKGKFHSKAYIFDYKDSGYEKGIAIVGSSNLTLSGLTDNTELNIVVHGNDNYEQLTKWFEELWNESEDFNEELIKIIKQSWALNEEITPYDIYIKTIYKLTEGERTYIKDFFDYEFLTSFQRDALKQAINKIEKFGGVFVSDVVGLGKTYIGAALLDYYEKRMGEKSLIICPASLKDMWENIVEEFELNSHVLSSGMLSQSDFNINEIKKYKNREVVLIDESHEFRNNYTNKYKNLAPFLQDKKVILLTATPRCNTHWDIYNQIKLFHPEDSIYEFSLNPPNMREFFRKVEEGRAKLKDFLRYILIRRTRKFILKWYGKEDENGKKYVEIGNKKQYFPQRILETKEYSIEKTYNGLYDQIRKKIKELTLARYNLYEYVLPELRNESPYSELKQAGKSLKGIMRVILFKRFESSIEAFRKTISNLIELNWYMIQSIEQGFIPAGEEAQKYMYSHKSKEEENFFEILEELSQRYDPMAFDIDKLVDDINVDLRLLKDIEKMISKIDVKNDDKFQTLKNLIETRLKNEKILIFTEYSDTAEYLYNNLKYLGNIEKVDSKTKDWLKIIKRFAPRSNNYELKEGEEEIQILISTDILSQGLNLQDAYIVINYDLHWNPVRLIQRIGRIDRIGSINDKIYCFNFLPEKEIEKHLGLKERVSRRIQEIHDTIGEDSKILDETERLNEEEMYAIYSGDEKVLDKEEEEESLTYEELKNIINELERADHQYLEKIKNLPDGIRSAKGFGNEKYLFTFLKCGDYEKLYLIDKNGNIIEDDIDEVLGFIKCEKNEKIGLKDYEMFELLPQIKEGFEEDIKKWKELKSVSKKMTPGQNYVLNELKIIYEKTDDLDLKERINLFSEIFKQELSSNAQKELRMIKRQGLKHDELLNRLKEIVFKYNLSIERTQEEISKKEEEDLVKIICSEIVNK